MHPFLETSHLYFEFSGSATGFVDILTQSKALTWIYISTHPRKCFISFMSMTTTKMVGTFLTTGVLNKHCLKYPAIYQEFKESGFPVRTSTLIFNKVPSDQVIKQNVNKGQAGSSTDCSVKYATP